MRARQPDVQGVVGGRDGGIASAYDVYNQGGSPTVVLLARHYRVITMDGRGNGRSRLRRGAGRGRRLIHGTDDALTPPARRPASRCTRRPRTWPANYADADADAIAAALAEELTRPPDYQPVPGDGAQRAAAFVAELI